MTSDLIAHKSEIKAAILGGESYNTVAKRYQCDATQVLRLLKNDPDIVKAKAAGLLNKRAPVLTAENVLQDPAVADVILNGMNVHAAAKKHGKTYAALWNKVEKAKKLLPVDTEKELAELADMLRSAAKRLNMRPEALAHDMIHRLAD